MEAPSVETLLVVVDGSDESLEAADLAVSIAGRYDAELAVLYVLDGAEYRALTAGEADPAERSADAQAFLERIDTAGRDASVPVRTATAYGYSARTKQVHPGSVVLDAAEEFDADFVVLPREPIGGLAPGEGTLAKAAEYVLLYASQPVLAV